MAEAFTPQDEETLMLLNLFQQTRDNDRKAMESTQEDDSRDFVFGPNSGKNVQATFQNDYKQRTTAYKEGVVSEGNLAMLYGRESDPRQGEEYIHTAQEGNPTSQWGVTQNNYPLNEGETLKQQASRVLQAKLDVVTKNSPRYKQQSKELQAALVPVMWNIGENAGAVKEFDYDNIKQSAGRVMQYVNYTPKGSKTKKKSKGLMNARVKDWNAFANTDEGKASGMTPITEYKEYLAQM